ncbi:hypothetical protein KTQ42_17205|uniref:hypothetical protein n=1 Tax=Noviherbaspirillum sp. L7-7A TaxID=2850560 RepID=UPI001C2B8202|nr:hypothetical protein [Noviherbaspirillum sp. L7-7A]MBV0881037.1 hypothetical protein [Noviherbaspirillum sp. L7-7A]
MEHWEVILEAGVEGGSITLYSRYTGKSWIFGRDVLDQTPTLIDEATIHYKSDSVYSWEEALELLDKHPWHLFYPVKIHPLFRGAVLAAVIRRSKHNAMDDDYGFRNWLTICGDLP